MKQILICISALFLIASCTNIKSRRILPYENLQYDVYRHTKDYYYIHLKYPNVEELSHYCWNLANSANDYRFNSYSEYKNEKKGNINASGAENLLHFLMNNKKDLSFKLKKGNMQFLWKSKTLLIFNLDYCELLKKPENVWNFFCLLDSTENHKIVVDNDDEDFLLLRKNVKQKWLSDHKLNLDVFNTPVLLRYNKTRGYTQFCPTDSMITENSYLKELGVALDTFLVRKNAETMQFATLVPSLRKEIPEF